MLGLISAINVLIGKLDDIVTQLTAIATNTTPADSTPDTTPDDNQGTT